MAKGRKKGKATGPCKKIAYHNEVAARLALATAQRKDMGNRPKIETRAYKCPTCHKWHLTSQR